ncbi:uncharacterized protein LOC123201038 [Mangifera indica]|uniref:uncharacterized protein LOC123201038 n=1 Tax=Mangifera indica TaxID=29780 RepID=UPI001CFAF863|nr:uncharacterized protein LOC123201038 [Mangifera indica]
MRPSFLILAISLLLLSLFLSGAQGIRLKKELLFSFGHLKAHNMHEEKGDSLKKESSDFMLCKEGHECSSSGMTRKLITSTAPPPSPSTTASNKNEENKANPTTKGKSSTSPSRDGETQSKQGKFPSKSPPSSEQYVDITDIAEMDYSPAKKKPPIHN